MTSITLTYLFLAYGVFWFVPLALLIIILVRLNRLSGEVAALRRRLDGDADGWSVSAARRASGQDPDLESA